MQNAYPARLLPKSSDNIITELNPDDVLCRRVDANVSLKDEQGKLQPEAIEIKRLPGFSLNKIPLALVEDIFIELNDKRFEAEWYVGDEGLLPSKDDFTEKSDRQYFLFKISSIHHFKAKYKLPGSQVENAEFSVMVVHKPLVANYWHFEFEIIDNEGNPLNSSKIERAWGKIIAASIRSRLIRLSKFRLDEFD